MRTLKVKPKACLTLVSYRAPHTSTDLSLSLFGLALALSFIAPFLCLCPQFPSLLLMHSLLAYDLKSSENESMNLESRLL